MISIYILMVDSGSHSLAIMVYKRFTGGLLTLDHGLHTELMVHTRGSSSPIRPILPNLQGCSIC